MKREPVDSSHIVSIGHDPASNTLEVEFKNGRIYTYHDVPIHKHGDLMDSDSVGKHFIDHIRDVHTTKRIK